MKKLISRLLLLVMTLAMVLSLAACGIRKRNSGTGSASGNITGESSRSELSERFKSEDENRQTDGNKKNALYDSVVDYVNSDAMQAALDSLKNTHAGKEMNIDIIAEEENKLVYIVTYETIAHTEGDGMTEALEAAMGTQDATFQQTANSIKPFVNSDEVLVEIRYIDMNGVIIYSKTYVSE